MSSQQDKMSAHQPDRDIVDPYASANRPTGANPRAMKDIGVGVLLIIAGTALTIISEKLMDGRMVIFWGLALVGVIQLLKGVWELVRS